MKVLYIDATVRENSRTSVLGELVLEKLGGEVSRVKLCEYDFPRTNAAYLAKRDKACAAGDFSDKMFLHARLFAEADVIVVAAPFWDMSFPAALKQFFEEITVAGLTFECRPDGSFGGLCKACKLYYVTTAGGTIFSEEYGFGYVKALARDFYGIGECVLFKAEGLDIWGADVESIMSAAKAEISNYLCKGT
ncbi:MAG: NAD(P)H-dependent oxidoreductase [Ruminococcus sp.]|uniref:NAD(P)H-dependent oxidoreductase n=1 Tax=Ruminococcus sp. TaxID=41978 RepID=UPI0025FC1F0A|nr:NAD(P)H-dependent oxidoreductase [Ruminococcus sp.]MBO4866330.1 NAD(P)H-dependent oxidoreductase [Ruminococcus sp.]